MRVVNLWLIKLGDEVAAIRELGERLFGSTDARGAGAKHDSDTLCAMPLDKFLQLRQKPVMMQAEQGELIIPTTPLCA